jgi:hypothetical protein
MFLAEVWVATGFENSIIQSLLCNNILYIIWCNIKENMRPGDSAGDHNFFLITL